MFTWIELVGDWADTPSLLVTAAVGYTVVTLAAQAVWGVETWTRRGEAFSVYFNLLSRISVFETRDRVVGVRPPLGGLPRLDQAPATVAVVMVMIGTVTFDGLSQGDLWNQIGPWLQDVFTSIGLSVDTALDLARHDRPRRLRPAHRGLLPARHRGRALGRRRLRRGRSCGAPSCTRSCRSPPSTSSPTTSPTCCSRARRSSTWPRIRSARAGTSSARASAAIDFSLISQNGTWYAQVAFVVVGHVAALTLAHDRALAKYGQQAQAVRSQYWMLSIMVGFTMLALWLLYQAGR